MVGSGLICFIVGMSNLFSKIEPDNKQRIIYAISKIEQTNTAKVFLVDSIEGIKGVVYEPWFKMGVDLSEGIWLGNNISNQFTLKVTTNSRILRAEIEANFGYTIKRGSATLTKFLSE